MRLRKSLLKAIQRGDTRKFYKSKEWRHKRQEILKRDNNECQKCKRAGRYSKAETVHHIKHLKNYPELALTDSNLESLCGSCHNEEHPEKLQTQAAKEIGVPVGTLGYWVAIDKKQTPDPEPAQVASQEPAQEAQEPVQDIICEEEEKNNPPEQVDEPIYNPEPVKMPIGCAVPKERISYTSAQYWEDVAQGSDFTAADEDSIPYIPAKAKEFDSDRFKLKLLEAIRECSWLDNAPDKITLAVMDTILYADLEV